MDNELKTLLGRILANMDDAIAETLRTPHDLQDNIDSVEYDLNDLDRETRKRLDHLTDCVKTLAHAIGMLARESTGEGNDPNDTLLDEVRGEPGTWISFDPKTQA